MIITDVLIGNMDYNGNIVTELESNLEFKHYVSGGLSLMNRLAKAMHQLGTLVRFLDIIYLKVKKLKFVGLVGAQQIKGSGLPDNTLLRYDIRLIRKPFTIY